MHSPPFIKVAVVAITSLTVMNFFFIAFFNADFVKAAMKIPTPYSCSRIGEGILGTICISVGLIMFLFFAKGSNIVRLAFQNIALSNRFMYLNELIFKSERQIKCIILIVRSRNLFIIIQRWG